MDGAHTTARKRTAHKRTAHKRTDGAQTGGSQTDAARTQTGRAVRRLPHRRAKPRAAEPSQPSQSSVPSQPSHWSAMPCRASRGASPRQGIIGAGRIIDDWSCWHAARAHVAACQGLPHSSLWEDLCARAPAALSDQHSSVHGRATVGEACLLCPCVCGWQSGRRTSGR